MGQRGLGGTPGLRSGSSTRYWPAGVLGPAGAVTGRIVTSQAGTWPASGTVPGAGSRRAGRDLARVFAACPDRVMPPASRALLAAGPGRSRLRDSAALLADEFRRALGL